MCIVNGKGVEKAAKLIVIAIEDNCNILISFYLVNEKFSLTLNMIVHLKLVSIKAVEFLSSQTQLYEILKM